METHLSPEHISLPSVDLLLGDFNCPPEPSRRAAGSFHLKAFADLYGLTRISPANTDYTFLSPTGVKSLIDHIFIRPDLAQLVLQCRTLIPPKSNHLLTLLDINLTYPKKGRALWRLHPSTASSEDVVRSIDALLSKTLTPLTSDIVSQWLRAKNSVAQLYTQWQNSLRHKASDAEREAILTLASLDPAQDPEKAAQARETLRRAAETRLRQAQLAAGLGWDLKVETPSRYLTARVKAREAQRTVASIRHPTTNQITNSLPQILDAFSAFYTNLYTERPDSPKLHKKILLNWETSIPREELQSLAHPITETEVAKAIASLNSSKAPDQTASVAHSTKSTAHD
jgi:hypothetical protein